jgi:diguanylate cyclase (GGDEF)-like protein/PAS domain S-box-containing protein
VRRLTGGPGSLHLHAWSAYLVAVTSLTTAYVTAHFVGPHWLNSGPVFNLIGGSVVVALVVGARRNSRDRRLPWYLLALAQTFFVTGDVLAYNYTRFFGAPLPFPSIADAFYLAVYPLLVAGLVLMIRQRSEPRNGASVIDALMFTVAAAALSWVYLMAPYAHDHTLSLTTKLTSIAYPVCDIMLLGVVLRLALGSCRRGAASSFLLAGTALVLITDTIYGWKLLHGGYATGGALDAGWAAFYALLGAAALHPSIGQLVEPAPRSDERLSRGRLMLLTCAALTAPALLLIRTSSVDTLDFYVLTVAAVVLFALVLLRMTGLVHRNEEAARRETTLRLGGEGLVAAVTREDIYLTALQTARSLTGQDVIARMYVTTGRPDRLAAVGSSHGDVASLSPLSLEELPATVRRELAEHRAATLEHQEQSEFLAPLFIRAELTGLLSVVCPRPLKRGVQLSLAALAREVALALQSAAMTERALYQRSEARLSSLVRNASDVICIVGEDAAIRYLSPSVQRMFGYLPDALADRRLSDIVPPEERTRVLAFIAATAAQPAGQPHAAEFRVRHTELGWRNVEALATNLLAHEAINGIVLNIRDVTERKAFEAELEHRAFHDTLTGLPNRALFRNRVGHALAGRLRGGTTVAVLLLDIDGFKDVNDSLGHVVGDEVLRVVGRRLDGCMRPVDTAARVGGDEFGVLIESSESEEHALEVAHRVRTALAPAFTLDGREVAIATSIGVALSGGEGSAHGTASELLHDADAAMYLAKQDGRGGYQIFRPEMHARALARLALKADLQRAMQAGEFTLRYQPIMDLRRRDIAGVEALARWEHPTRGTVAPIEFIPLLEETGLIVAFGRQILTEACEQAVLLQRACSRTPPLMIAVNVSAFQLRRPEFVDEVRAVLEATEIEPSSLILELTESMMIEDMDLSIRRMNALRSLGVKLAIDDFGTGYSSLTYLRRLPVDILKIDRSFLADPSQEATLLTAAIVQLAGIFKLQVVLEGIEDASHLERLADMQADFGQGFHFAKPLPATEIMAMAERRSQMPIPAGEQELLESSTSR